ncbi:centrosomal protein of 57 kDa isoform X1 [Ascaphus truei]|uniref:centrosomal protein of 57 kDa isoform X1 n=1 Tax=Ascaphus truei TaxID=8439 RepID=UPI003F5ACC2C
MAAAYPLKTLHDPLSGSSKEPSTQDAQSTSSYAVYPRPKPFINSELQRSHEKPVLAYPQSNSRAIFSALKNLQEKIRKLELERVNAEDSMKRLSHETVEYKKRIDKQIQFKDGFKTEGSRQNKDLSTQLSAAESRCDLLEKQLVYMRKMVQNAESERTSVLEKQVSLEGDRNLEQLHLQSKLEKLDVLEQEYLKLTTMQVLAENKIREMEQKLREEEHQRKLVQEKATQLKLLSQKASLLPRDRLLKPPKRAHRRCLMRLSPALSYPFLHLQLQALGLQKTRLLVKPELQLCKTRRTLIKLKNLLRRMLHKYRKHMRQRRALQKSSLLFEVLLRRLQKSILLLKLSQHAYKNRASDLDCSLPYSVPLSTSDRSLQEQAQYKIHLSSTHMYGYKPGARYPLKQNRHSTLKLGDKRQTQKFAKFSAYLSQCPCLPQKSRKYGEALSKRISGQRTSPVHQTDVLFSRPLKACEGSVQSSSLGIGCMTPLGRRQKIPQMVDLHSAPASLNEKTPKVAFTGSKPIALAKKNPKGIVPHSVSMYRGLTGPGRSFLPSACLIISQSNPYDPSTYIVHTSMAKKKPKAISSRPVTFFEHCSQGTKRFNICNVCAYDQRSKETKKGQPSGRNLKKSCRDKPNGQIFKLAIKSRHRLHPPWQ